MAQRVPVFGNRSPLSPTHAFYKNEKMASQRLLSPSQQMKTMSEKKAPNASVFSQKALAKYTRNQIKTKLDACICPHVLVADDDTFQHIYYRGLFHKSLDFEEIKANKENLRVQLYYSGEELAQKFEEIKRCGCDELMMIITDYHMGEKRLDGVSVSIKLREAGYKGILCLRTSETKEYLQTKHENFNSLLEEKTMNDIIEKTNLRQGKETIQNFMQKAYKEKSQMTQYPF